MITQWYAKFIDKTSFLCILILSIYKNVPKSFYFREFGACSCTLPSQPVWWQSVMDFSTLIRLSVSRMVIHLMPMGKSLYMCKFLTFKMLILEDTVWIPSGVQGVQGLFYGIPAVPAELASLMSCTGNPPQPSVLQPILKKHHSKALRLPVNGRLKFMMTGQLVNMDLLFFLLCVYANP